METKGNIKVGDESAGVNAVNSTTVVSGGNVEVGTNAGARRTRRDLSALTATSSNANR